MHIIIIQSFVTCATILNKSPIILRALTPTPLYENIRRCNESNIKPAN